MRKFIKIMLGLMAVLAVAVISAVYAFRNPISAAPATSYSFAGDDTGLQAGGDVHLSIMVTATVTAPEAIMFEGGSLFRMRQMAHSAILVCHPQGLLMFDTGLGKNVDTQFEDMPFWMKPFLSYEVTTPAIEQLDAQAFCPGRNLQIILSHLHWDHASGIEDFAAIPVWVPQSELESGRLAGNSSGYLLNQFDNPQIDWHPLGFDGEAHLNYENSLDFFGDGQVILVPMEGHTAGSVGMFVNLGPDQRYFFTGDISWSLEGFTRPAHKSALMRVIADGDVDKTEDEIRRVHALMQHDPSLKVIPAHDLDAYISGAIYPDKISAR